jgi:hypothetical protein
MFEREAMERKYTSYISISSVLICSIIILSFFGCGNNNYEKKQLDKGELYYNNTVSQTYIESLGNYINQCEILTDDVNKARITRTNDTFELSLSVPFSKINSETYQDYAEILATQLSEDVFNHSPVKIHLTDADFNAKVTKSSSQTTQ